MPAKISPPSGYACRIVINVYIPDELPHMMRPTRATAPPMVAENALMTFTVGSNHLVNLSSLLPPADWPNPGICCRSMVIISSGVARLKVVK